jgi:signal peptidase II
MHKARLTQRKWNTILLVIAFVIVAADRITKIWVQANIALNQSVPETGFFRLTHVQNTGAAFSLFRGRTSILSIISILGLIFLLLYVFKLSRYFPTLDTRFNKIALGLILGGDIGNLIDRLYYGHVTDFIDTGAWPIWNIADAAMVVGVILFVLSLFLAEIKAEGLER